MPSIISTKTSGGGGIAVTGDTSGVLEIQSNNGTTAVTIDASQNVGIGTASPATKFNVSSTGQLVAKFQSTSTGLYDGACVYLNSSGGTDNQGTYLYHGIENAGDSTNTTFQLQQRGNSGTYVRTMYLVDYKNQFQYWATSGTERMRIDSSGRVTMPFQPCFQVGFSTGTTTTVTSGNKVLWNAIDFENGSNFNTSSNRYTAPVTGKYKLTASWHNNSTNATARPVYKVNGSDYTITSDAAQSIMAVTGSECVLILDCIIPLNAGDYVEIFQRGGGGTLQFYSGHSWWSGYLIG
jgi:hypothetical protein